MNEVKLLKTCIWLLVIVVRLMTSSVTITPLLAVRQPLIVLLPFLTTNNIFTYMKEKVRRSEGKQTKDTQFIYFFCKKIPEKKYFTVLKKWFTFLVVNFT